MDLAIASSESPCIRSFPISAASGIRLAIRKTREILMNIWVYDNELSNKINAP